MNHGQARRVTRTGAAVLVLAGVALLLASAAARPASALAGCRIYVASGDDIASGHDLNNDAKRYPDQLLADHLKAPGWCLFNQAKNGQSSSSYISGGGMSNAYNMRPDLLTIQLGEQNSSIVDLITSCFDKVKSHDFTGANTCAAVKVRAVVSKVPRASVIVPVGSAASAVSPALPV